MLQIGAYYNRIVSDGPVLVALCVRIEFSFVGNCEKEPKEKGLMSAYQHFGLHDIYMNELISRFTCEDKLFSKNDLFHFGKTYPKPTV